MSTQDTLTVTVDLGPRSYDILVGDGLLDDLGELIAPIVKTGRVHFVTDQTVFDLYRANLYALERDITVTVLSPGEARKSFEDLQKVLDDMFDHGLGRSDTVIAFGGGVIGDLTGFAASIYKRGCQFIQVPTTLLAQVDSSVGGKTAINVPQGKNLVGAFYQPKQVIIDTDVLKTLPIRELKAGYAEVLKYGLLGDRGFFNWLEENGDKVLALDRDAAAYAIARSCEAKARIVADDEREQGRRALLNLGHTFAHALEAEAGYGGRLLHGEAVAAGMEMAFDFSVQSGLCQEADRNCVRDHLERTHLTRINDVADLLSRPNQLYSHMMQDKKNTDGKLTLILARAIGEAYIEKNADSKRVLTYLQSLKQTYA